MENLVENMKWVLAGNVYSDTFENVGDGGPSCFNELSIPFRLTLSSISAVINIFLIYILFSKVKKSKELQLNLIKDVNPNWVEKIVGYTSLLVYIIMVVYKILSGRLVYMLNPCHMCLLQQSYLLLTKKTQFRGLVFIQYIRWIFGPWFALQFPNLDGYYLPFEYELFYIEHYLAAFFGPVTLILAGRYGFFKVGFTQWVAEQWWGFAFHSLFNRVISLPVSILTWANINFNLCKARSDPFLPLVGEYYLYFVDHYLNSASFLCILLVLLFSLVTYCFVVYPWKKITGLFISDNQKTKQN